MFHFHLFYPNHDQIMSSKRSSLLNDIGALYKDHRKAAGFSGLNKIYITYKQHTNVRYNDIKPIIQRRNISTI